MQIEQVKIHQICLPFSFDFSHALRKRSSVNNVIVEVIANHGEIKGYGEGAPRSYVTGESQESVVKSIGTFTQDDSFPWELNEVSQIWHFVKNLPNGKEHHSAICALENALLDSLGKEEGKSVIQCFRTDSPARNVYYGAVIPLAGNRTIVQVCELIAKIKIKKLRLKMGKDFKQNRESIDTVKTIFGDGCDLRVDVNGAWDYKLALKHSPLLKKYRVKVVEQPMMPDDPDIGMFARIMQNSGVILMADESACSLLDMQRIVTDGHYGMINIRISKCGGFQKSLSMIDFLRNNGISFQIGCQLGESGILSAAGRVLSLLCKDAVYHDGSYDEFLLKENVTVEDVSFGPRGKAGSLDGPGLGVRINSQSLERLSTDSTKRLYKQRS